jgi:hypothetical protein
MKLLADLVRQATPTWTDKDRYKWLSILHSWLVPACLFFFIFVSNPLLRFMILCIQMITIVTEFFFKECLITMVEKEFSEETWDDIANKIFKANGWELTRPEKMSFNIGINVGVFLVFVLMLLKESLLWMVGFAGLSMATLPSMWLYISLRSQPGILSQSPIV